MHGEGTNSDLITDFLVRTLRFKEDQFDASVRHALAKLPRSRAEFVIGVCAKKQDIHNPSAFLTKMINDEIKVPKSRRESRIPDSRWESETTFAVDDLIQQLVVSCGAFCDEQIDNDVRKMLSKMADSDVRWYLEQLRDRSRHTIKNPSAYLVQIINRNPPEAGRSVWVPCACGGKRKPEFPECAECWGNIRSAGSDYSSDDAPYSAEEVECQKLTVHDAISSCPPTTSSPTTDADDVWPSLSLQCQPNVVGQRNSARPLRLEQEHSRQQQQIKESSDHRHHHHHQQMLQQQMLQQQMQELSNHHHHQQQNYQQKIEKSPEERLSNVDFTQGLQEALEHSRREEAAAQQALHVLGETQHRMEQEIRQCRSGMAANSEVINRLQLEAALSRANEERAEEELAAVREGKNRFELELQQCRDAQAAGTLENCSDDELKLLRTLLPGAFHREPVAAELLQKLVRIEDTRRYHGMKLRVLQNYALQMGVSEDLVDDAGEKRDLVALILEKKELEERGTVLEKGSSCARECVVCLEQPMTHLFMPCGHKCVCEGCADEVVKGQDPRCPICCMQLTPSCLQHVRVWD